MLTDDEIRAIINEYHPDSAMTELAARVLTAEARVKVLEEALRWYASSAAWTFAEVQGPDGDYGKRARKALEAGK